MTADTLTQLIAKVQAQLIDAGTLFTTATVTAAVRQALADLNLAIPQNAAVVITAIASQKEYELTDADPNALNVIDVLRQGSNDIDFSIPYYAYNEDSRVFFRLREPEAAGTSIIVRYAVPHTISGLDSSTDSTLTDPLNVAIINGTCYYACIIRAAAMIESNNVALVVPENYLKAANVWKSVFQATLKAARRQPTARGEPSTQAWNDKWHLDERPW